jgi:hypothetical protein
MTGSAAEPSIGPGQSRFSPRSLEDRSKIWSQCARHVSACRAFSSWASSSSARRPSPLPSVAGYVLNETVRHTPANHYPQRPNRPHEVQLIRTISVVMFSCGTACQARRESWVALILGRVEPEVRRLGAVEQAAGPRCQGWSARRAKPEDERPLTVGWRLLRHRRARCYRWGAGSVACRTRQPVVDRATASLMYAGRDRSVWMRRSWPHSVFASGDTG